MRRGWWGAAVVAVLACQGELLRIDVPQESETTIPKATLVETLLGDLGFGDFVDMDITASQELQNQGVQPGDIVDVRLTAFSLTVTSPSSGDLSFVTSLEVYVEAPGLPRVLLASGSDFPAGQARVDLDLEDVDLTDYAVSQSMTIELEAEGSRPEDDTRVLAATNLSVGVTAQGACNAIQGASSGG